MILIRIVSVREDYFGVTHFEFNHLERPILLTQGIVLHSIQISFFIPCMTLCTFRLYFGQFCIRKNNLKIRPNKDAHVKPKQLMFSF